MRVSESCAKCLFDRQKHLTTNSDYLEEISQIIKNRDKDDTSPYLVYRFTQVYETYFGRKASYEDVKKKYNDLVLSMENHIRQRIERDDNPLAKALVYARAGNYIDFGAMNSVDETAFLALLEETSWNEAETEVFSSFVRQCENAKQFLLIADNCGEIVLDKLFLEQLHKRFPGMELSVLVRGEEVLNDATAADAAYVGIDKVAKVITNGLPIAGTIYDMLPKEAKQAVDQADVILAKGQGNYESLNGQGRHIFFSFLCKCDLFTSRFSVPRLTGIFVEEMSEKLAL